TAAHDLSEGGLAQALVESVVRFGTGASVDLTELLEHDGVDLFSALFSESQARALWPSRRRTRSSSPPSRPSTAPRCCVSAPPAAERGDRGPRLGSTGGDALDITGVGTFGVGELRELREGTLPRHFG